MPLELNLILLGLVAIIGAFSTLAAKTGQSSPRAVGMCIVLMTMMPLNGAAPAAIFVGLMAMIAVLAIALVRDKPGLRRPGILVAVVLFLVVLRMGGVLTEQTIGPLAAGVTIVLSLLAFVSSRLDSEGVLLVTRVLAALVLVHFGYALLEVVFRIPGIWSMSNGSNDIANRVHELFGWLPGRPMTSFSHPIPLAYFFLVAGVFTWYQAGRRGRRRYWWPTLVALLGITLTGTRSALVAVIVVIALAFAIGMRARKLLFYPFLIVVGLLAANSRVVENATKYIGLGDEFATSASYRHRTIVAGSLPDLFSHDVSQVLFGWGTDVRMIFDRGIVPRYSSSFYFFDNQFVALMAQYGLIGLGLFIVVLLFIAIRGRTLEWALLGVIVTMSFSFDLLTHLIGLGSLALVAGLASSSHDRHPKEIAAGPGRSSIAHVETSTRVRARAKG